MKWNASFKKLFSPNSKKDYQKLRKKLTKLIKLNENVLKTLKEIGQTLQKDCQKQTKKLN